MCHLWTKKKRLITCDCGNCQFFMFVLHNSWPPRSVPLLKLVFFVVATGDFRWITENKKKNLILRSRIKRSWKEKSFFIVKFICMLSTRWVIRSSGQTNEWLYKRFLINSHATTSLTVAIFRLGWVSTVLNIRDLLPNFYDENPLKNSSKIQVSSPAQTPIIKRFIKESFGMLIHRNASQWKDQIRQKIQ